MLMTRRASEADFTFVAPGYDGELRVLSFNGNEAMSEPFRYTIRLASLDPNIEFRKMIGLSACLTIYSELGKRYVNGIITRMTQLGIGNRYSAYTVELMPKIWLLSLRHGSRIFQEMNVQDIITKVLQDAGISSELFRFELKAEHPKREYCVQYRESDLNFISRLMEEEGIFYFFEHDDERHVMVISDHPDVHHEIESPQVVFRERSGMVQESENIYEFRFSKQVKPSKIVLRDFNFKQPSLDGMEIESKELEALDLEEYLEIYDYPGLYEQIDAGSYLAQVRVQSLRTFSEVGQGSSICRRLVPGYMFTMTDHPRGDFNGQYLITRLVTTASQPLGEDTSEEGSSYNNEFECIPATVTFRPPLKTPKPRIDGIQTAIVVGPSGEEIYTDEYGRVKVQFHWDREGNMDEDSSCWIRVSQIWAGKGWGAMFIPRIGQEVIVDFLDGDPDRPIIIGCVYNGENPTPYELPKRMTVSTIKSESSLGGNGYNEIRFEDDKGREELFIHAQKDMNQVIRNNMNTRVGVDQSIDIGHNRSKYVQNDQTETIGNDKNIEVGNDHYESIGNDMKIGIRNNHLLSVGNDMEVLVGNDLSQVIDGNQSQSIGKDLEISVKGSKKESIKGDRSCEVSSNSSEKITGDSSIVIDGKLSESARTIEVQASAGITMQSKTSFEAIGNTEAKVSSLKVLVDGNVEVQIACGGSTIKMTPANITISSGSGQIILDPSGVTIVGALVRIN